ncbi:MAG: sulfur carrier protein ThiS [Spongiibacteraceae bacterium]|nr:sulfur carrier protein ThiS [Spongiibacteraceae bacterium]
MITISVNNEQKQLDTPCSLSFALVQWDYRSEKIAVAINGEFVPRGSYADCVLSANDCIDIVAPIQGG